MGYMGILAIPQLFFGRSVVMLNLTNALLGVASIWAVFAILRATYPDCSPRDRCLLTAIYAFWPAMLASYLNMSPDSGILVFLLLTVAFLLQGQTLPAAVAGLFLAFSKETGALLYVLALGTYALLLSGNRSKILQPSSARLTRPWILAIPLVVLSLNTVAQFSRNRPPIYAALQQKGHWSFDPRTVVSGPYAPAIWILNGGWVLTLSFAFAPVVALLFAGARRRWESREIRGNRRALFLALFFAGSVYALTRYETFVNVRYLLPIYALLVPLWFLPISIILGPGRARSICLALVLAWIASGIYRTTDPVSKWAWGTFDFGDHKILSLTSLTGECCGFGRDQLPYNLEFLRFGEISNQIFGWIRPTAATTLAANVRADRLGRIDSEGRRTLRTDDRTLTIHFSTPEIIERRVRQPDLIYFVAFPNFVNTADLLRLRKNYGVESVRTFAKAGYAIPVYVLRR
jgi:hypothetical protein